MPPAVSRQPNAHRAPLVDPPNAIKAPGLESSASPQGRGCKPGAEVGSVFAVCISPLVASIALVHSGACSIDRLETYRPRDAGRCDSVPKTREMSIRFPTQSAKIFDQNFQTTDRRVKCHGPPDATRPGLARRLMRGRPRCLPMERMAICDHPLHARFDRALSLCSRLPEQVGAAALDKQPATCHKDEQSNRPGR
jgi:hypothetical protein